ncbi:MAG TPA: hypothetical protein VMN81_02060 [Vicinamibacterales bacterium]|nr:hypothetical protein [Vicinamibacterales bacterium]
MPSPQRLALLVAALCFVWLHALTVPHTLLDEDGVNLAMGVESYNIARYAPHPPGYPVYIALGKASTAAVSWLEPDWPRGRRAAAGLAWLSILSGALGIFAFAALWTGLGVPSRWAVLAAIATAAAPLYWFTAARPLTDTPGLVAAVAIQAAFLHGLRRFPERAGLPAVWVAASLATGLAIGLRSQTMWLTLPLLAWVLAGLVRHRRWTHGLALAGAALAGVLIWLIPVIQITGFEEYRSLLAGQGRHDVRGVAMLAANPSWLLLKEDLVQTFLAPWRLIAVPWLVVGAAAAGLVRVTAGSRRALILLAVLVLPYLTFHLLFHEVETIRYALPTVSMVAGLAVVSLAYLGRYAGGIAAVAAAVACVAATHPVTATYASGAPVFRVINEIRAAMTLSPLRPRLEAHHRAWWATSRALDWNRPNWDVEAPTLVNREESLRLVDYWRSGATTPIWFLSDPDRRDLQRFAPGDARHERTYRLEPAVAALVGGRRPYDAGWWRLSPPAWMLGRGWALTREMAGEAAEPHAATAFLRRHDGASAMFIGARHLETVRVAVEVTASLDGLEIDRWPIAAGESFVRRITLPEGALRGAGAYAVLSLALRAKQPLPARRVIAFDQFAAASDAGTMVAFGRGWSAVEGDPAGGARSRRASRLSELEVRHAGRPLRLTIRGSAPAADFAVPPQIAIFAGSRLLAQLTPDRVFEVSVDVQPEELDAAAGTITIAVDLRRTLDERRRGGRPRKYGLRVTGVEIVEGGAH